MIPRYLQVGLGRVELPTSRLSGSYNETGNGFARSENTALCPDAASPRDGLLVSRRRTQDVHSKYWPRRISLQIRHALKRALAAVGTSVEWRSPADRLTSDQQFRAWRWVA